MAPRGERKIRQQDVIPVIRKELAQIPGVRAFAAPYPMIGGQRGEPLQFVINGPNLDEVGRIAKSLQQTLSSDSGLGRMDLDLQLDLPQLVLDPDRTRIASAGLTTQDVALALNCDQNNRHP